MGGRWWWSGTQPAALARGHGDCRDSTLSLGGRVHEAPLGYLARQVVTVATSLFEGGAEPVIEIDDKRIPLGVVDTIANGKKGRPRRRPGPERPTAPSTSTRAARSRPTPRKDYDDHPF